MKAIRLRTEYLVNPLGIDVQHPRLIPANCEALVHLPDGKEYTAGFGTHTYSMTRA